MRLMAVADFHGKPESKAYLSKCVERKDLDALVIMGDLTQFGPVSAGEEVLEPVKDLKIPVLCVPGNCDPKTMVEVLEKWGINLHGKRLRLGEWTFLGLGGSNITPFNTPFEFTENEIWEALTSLLLPEDRKVVLITHTPPFNSSSDLCRGGAHAGSKSVRRFIEEKNPILNLCAHIHEARGIERIGRTLVVNPGPLFEGYAAQVVLEGEEARAELLKL
ncbi:MAG: metallophosphoesterase [Candidatus Hadarchaeales archaeon]